ncbi:MAG TPA: hypothetical protein VIK02_07805 [Candidatus Anoxymicrobiaceae bacterium]
MHLAIRRKPFREPLAAPYFWIARTMYSEQLGSNGHERRAWLDISLWYVWMDRIIALEASLLLSGEKPHS